MLYTIFFCLVFLPLTLFFAVLIIILAFLGPGGNLPHRASNIWAGLVLRLARIRLEVDPAAFDPSGRYILMANHQSWFDIPVLMTALKGHRFLFVAKDSLFRIPFFGQALSRIGYVAINRDNPRKGMKSIQEAIDKAKNASILIFPEGTRCNQLGEFKIGGMILAIKSERPIVPVLISGTDKVLPKNSLRITPGPVAVKIFPVVETRNTYALKEREKLKEDMWNLMYAHFKETEAWLAKKRP